MMYADENARIKLLKKLIAHWPNYDVIGNKPYAKGCYLIRRGQFIKGHYIPPEVIFATTKNYDMKLVMEHVNFHPERALECAPHEVLVKQGYTAAPGLLGVVPPDYRILRRELCAKAIALVEEGLQLAAVFMDKQTLATQTTADAMKTLKRIWKHNLKA